MIWPKKASKVYSHKNIVRANKRQVNEFGGGENPARLVNNDTILLESEYIESIFAELSLVLAVHTGHGTVSICYSPV